MRRKNIDQKLREELQPNSGIHVLLSCVPNIRVTIFPRTKGGVLHSLETFALNPLVYYMTTPHTKLYGHEVNQELIRTCCRTIDFASLIHVFVNSHPNPDTASLAPTPSKSATGWPSKVMF